MPLRVSGRNISIGAHAAEITDRVEEAAEILPWRIFRPRLSERWFRFPTLTGNLDSGALSKPCEGCGPYDSAEQAAIRIKRLRRYKRRRGTIARRGSRASQNAGKRRLQTEVAHYATVDHSFMVRR